MTSLERFIQAQQDDYLQALEEIHHGQKETHWMWYIFPQITGLGMSEISEYYAIKSLEEAKAYLSNEYLKQNLLEISSSLLELKTCDASAVFGPIDALKLKSCMTLFAYISDYTVFRQVLDKFYNGIQDEHTIAVCKRLEK